jgi:hypothetical protein
VLQAEIAMDPVRACPSDEQPPTTQSEVKAVPRRILVPDENLDLGEETGSIPCEDVSRMSIIYSVYFFSL